jgi:CBS domain-containing protein
MSAADLVQRVRIYLSSDDVHEGRPLYLAVLDELRRGGATGATALTGLAGFGPGQRVRIGPERAASQPVVIEWIDRAERVRSLLPAIEALAGGALITLEDVPVYRAMLRARGPFAADRSVGDSMRSPAPSVPVEAPLSAALAAMARDRLATLPVVDAEGRLAGLITDQELAWRGGLHLGLGLLDTLTSAERDPILSPLIGRGVAELMRADPRSVLSGTSIPQALVTMVESGYSHVPVVDREGRLLGLLGPDEVLSAAVEQATAAESAVRDADPPAPVRLVMQAAAAQVTIGQPLAVALAQLLAAPDRRALVVDREGCLIGLIEAASALRELGGDERLRFLAALQQPAPPPAAALPGAERSFDSLIQPAPPAVAPDMPALAAARRLLELGAERLPVVNAEQRLLGIIARGGLVRALLQQSD